MEKKKRRPAFTILACLVIAVFLKTTLVQLVPSALGIWIQHIDWLLLITVYIGLQRDPVNSLLTGTVAGILNDAFSNGQAIGVSGLSYVIAAFIAYRITVYIVVDNLLVRLLAVSLASVISLIIRLIFYRILNFELPVLSSTGDAAQAMVFGIIANLFVSVLLFSILDRLFKQGLQLRMRRSEARRRRF